MQAQDHIPLEDGWQKMEGGFSKFIDIMEGGFREPFALALHSELYTLSYAAHLIAHQLSAAHCTLNFQSALRTRTGPAVYQLAAEQEPHERDEDRHHCGVFHGDGGAEHPLQRCHVELKHESPEQPGKLSFLYFAVPGLGFRTFAWCLL